MFSYRTLNNITGWLVFVISTGIYTLTMEPTVSFWDCGEFIAGAYKLQIVHPPGAPLFLMIGRLFALFASDPTAVPVLVNFSSALASGFTMLFLCWTIMALAKKLLQDDQNKLSKADTIVVLASGIVGSLACTVTDTMWFSAVEGEVYAFSSFLTAFVFWAILKWEAVADRPYADRWLLLITFVIGLSVGVHLLNLLTIPAIALVYYFKRYRTSKTGIFKALLIGGGILGVIQFALIPGIPLLAAHFDRIMVNSFGMPFWSGMILFFVILAAGITWGLYKSRQTGRYLLHSSLLAFSLFLIGYMSYSMVVIRANANPSINMTHPSDLFSLLNYLNRSQYESTPLLKGPYYTSQPSKIEEGGIKYGKGEDKYRENGKWVEYGYEKEYFFPRIHHWRDENHQKFYANWLGLGPKEEPKFSDNMNFFVSYQLGFMYWRYFLWNFSGRQNDLQGHGDVKKGNWLTGLPFIDDTRLAGNQWLAPENKYSKGFNRYFMLPFILGLFGMLYQFKQRPREAFTILLLFFFTGLAVILFLNQPPQQPRERDYAYAGSIYTFCIWIGLSVPALYRWVRNSHWKQYGFEIAGALVTLVALLAAGFFARHSQPFHIPAFLTSLGYVAGVMAMIALALAGIRTVIASNTWRAVIVSGMVFAVPVWMCLENWDDHDRSETYLARDFAHNYLNSCPPDAILFTFGDNETYPIWYAQEVEGVRPDIRIVNLSLLGAPWHGNQLRRKVNESEPVPLSLSEEKCNSPSMDYVRYYENPKLPADKFYNIKQVVDFINSEALKTKLQAAPGEYIDYLPSRNLRIPVDREKVLENGTVAARHQDKIPESLEWKIPKNVLYRNDLMVLDVLATNNWNRPICFPTTINPSSLLNLQEYIQLEGMTYRLTPIRGSKDKFKPGSVNIAAMYDTVVNKFRWSHQPGNRVLLNDTSAGLIRHMRMNYARLAEVLAEDRQMAKAKTVLDTCIRDLPEEILPFDLSMLSIASMYYTVKDPENARLVVGKIRSHYEEQLEYYLNLSGSYHKAYQPDTQQAMAVLNELIRICTTHQDTEWAEELQIKFRDYQEAYLEMMG